MWQALVRIADINIEFNTKFSMRDVFYKFFADFDNPDLKITVTEDDLNEEMMKCSEEERLLPSCHEETCMYRKLYHQLWKFDAILFHSASFKYKNRGIAFTAKSGTGKTTHLKLWQQMLGDELVIINGDKPIIRFINDKPVLYGSPWCGKERYGGNFSSPLTDICYIERAQTNSVEKMSQEEVLNYFFDQIVLPDDTLGRIITLQLVNKLMNTCNFWKIKCNMNPDAAEVSFDKIVNNSGD